MDAVPCLNLIYNLLAYSRGASPESPCRGGVLSSVSPTISQCSSKPYEDGKNETIAVSSAAKTLVAAIMTSAATATATTSGAATSTTSLLQRSRTGAGTFDEPSTTPSPTKSRLHFLEGFRSTLRPRSPVRSNSIPIVPGSRVRLTADWGKLRAGEELEISRLEGPGLIVSPVVGREKKEEFWIPASLVPNSSISRAWSFRPRRIDSEAAESVRVPREQPADENGPPAILTIPCSIRATAGGAARLVLEVRRAERAIVSWKKEGQRGDIERTDRYRICQTADYLSLEIVPCLPSDSGLYHCRVDHETGSCSAKIPLRVVGIGPNVWNAANESNAVDESADNEPSIGPSVDDNPVLPGRAKSPRSSKNAEVAGREAAAATWFAETYVEPKELGSGRFAKVYRARDQGTGREVALKQVARSKQSRSLTRAEYDLLRAARHDNIVRAFALFEEAPHPDTDTIVLELVNGSSVFAYLGAKIDYTEGTVSRYTGQLLSALWWLHSRKRAHLDIKPENVLIDRDKDAVKLIDFGEAVKTAPLDQVVPPVDLEFAAPESVLGKPMGPYTDMWATGVFIYVLLSGLSPFLDDSIEETTTNILKCDFCFPEEYFETISSDAKDLLRGLLCLRGEERATARFSLSSPWFQISTGTTIPSSRMAAFIDRRAHRSKSRQDRNSSLYS